VIQRQYPTALSGYVMTCCMEDLPEDEMRRMLFGSVLRMAGPALGHGPVFQMDLAFMRAASSFILLSIALSSIRLFSRVLPVIFGRVKCDCIFIISAKTPVNIRR
jgi:hypothetical protein